MAQVKIYGLKENLFKTQEALSEAIHSSIVEVLAFPQEKKYQRFMAFEASDMLFASTKSKNYTIIEIMMMEGRKMETKKRLIQTLFHKIEQEVGIAKTDIEICIIESPSSHWGFSGKCGDEIELNYKIDI